MDKIQNQTQMFHIPIFFSPLSPFNFSICLFALLVAEEDFRASRSPRKRTSAGAGVLQHCCSNRGKPQNAQKGTLSKDTPLLPLSIGIQNNGLVKSLEARKGARHGRDRAERHGGSVQVLANRAAAHDVRAAEQAGHHVGP